jgi:hypothetical protein
VKNLSYSSVDEKNGLERRILKRAKSTRTEVNGMERANDVPLANFIHLPFLECKYCSCGGGVRPCRCQGGRIGDNHHEDAELSVGRF